MKRLLLLILPALAALSAFPAFALEDADATALPQAAAPIPLSTGWVEGFLLLIVWLFVLAVIIGPLVTYFRLEPRSAQLFVDDKKIRAH